MMRDYFYEPETIFDLVRTVFSAAAVTCFLWASHRVARGLILNGQVSAYDALEDAYTPEEREQLIHKIKHSSLRY
jgi:hypothetical protein